jgi:hypothetical protein
MSPARRSAKRRGWPQNLYEPRPNYFVYRHPKTKQTFVLGYVPLAHARNEAMLANRLVQDEPLPSLVAMIQGETHTVADLIAKMPPPPKASSAKTARSQDKRILAAMGQRECREVTVKHCADLIDSISAEGKETLAAAVRARLRALFRFAIRSGWMKEDPASVTEKPRVIVRRGRLSLEQFLKIREIATEYLLRAMNLALVTGQDRSTIAAMQRADVKDGHLICQRSKTEHKNAPIAIPVALRLDALGLSIDDLLRERTKIISPFLVHHTIGNGAASAGDPVHVDRISDAFTEARRAAGIPDVDGEGKGAPTFHEIRSLAKRLYDAQGNVDTKQLLGHATEQMGKLYADPRNMTPVVVSVVKTK